MDGGNRRSPCQLRDEETAPFRNTAPTAIQSGPTDSCGACLAATWTRPSRYGPQNTMGLLAMRRRVPVLSQTSLLPRSQCTGPPSTGKSTACPLAEKGNCYTPSLKPYFKTNLLPFHSERLKWSCFELSGVLTAFQQVQSGWGLSGLPGWGSVGDHAEVKGPIDIEESAFPPAPPFGGK